MTQATATEIDPVVIRVWKGNDDDVFALFPTLPADTFGNYCTCYQHVGQHSSADYNHCIHNSRPATEAEAADLLAELKIIGYNPRVCRRATPAMHSARRDCVQELATA
jgi:hypothetical protein